MCFSSMAITLTLLNAVGTRQDVIEPLIIVGIMWRRSSEIVWSIVDGIGSNGQEVGLKVKITCSVSSVAISEICASER